jgi:hypothetical protein
MSFLLLMFVYVTSHAYDTVDCNREFLNMIDETMLNNLQQSCIIVLCDIHRPSLAREYGIL